MREVRRISVGSLVAGPLVGVVWWLLSPTALLRDHGGSAYYAGRAAEAEVAADGWFAVCALVTGSLLGLLAALGRRGFRLWALVALTLGGVVGSVLAWRVGAVLGPDSIDAQLDAVREGATFRGPLQLSALGVLLVWPISAVTVFFAAVAGLDSPAIAGPAPTATADEHGRQDGHGAVSPADRSGQSAPT